MEYRFSFNKRMLVWLGVAQFLLLALCFAIGLVSGQYRSHQAAAALPSAPATTSPHSPATPPQAQASGKIKSGGIALNEGE
ncbi:hypothetical protein ACFOLJ_23735 [Rugamonas sp. CCM 8940]|uniref:hypothetical protein n=1 Tax=Rugamonas sp. CCM 8940 TaxID=2765359 RepID=UPI0018F639B3|nr:hypothetical protein [Rugamonas sp. CCM 8940]MBJ7313466.1 hypothetical protein [Rugamonas sp. CCM 8940]